MASIIVIASIFLALYFVIKIFLRRKNDPLPPGPRGLPLVGNINEMPPPGEPEFRHWLKYKDLYGPISSLTVLGQTTVILHDKKIALELMEKRSAIYSARPKMKFVHDIIGLGEEVGSRQNDAAHRLQRKYAHKQFGSKTAISKYSSTQEEMVGQLLCKLKQNRGKNVDGDLRANTGGYILKVVYDYNIESQSSDPLVDLSNNTFRVFAESSIPGKWLVDTLPVLEYAPKWFPGTGFKKVAPSWSKIAQGSVNIPYNFIKGKRHQKMGGDSFVSRLIDEAENDNHGMAMSKEQEHAIKWTAFSLYIGGEGTSALTMTGFFLAMSMFPEAQRKAQEEIDRVVGSERLPGPDDRDSLPYLNAVVMESLRWHVIGPLGMPHVTEKEDHINGYRIPKGSTIISNVWWFTRDPKVYQDPEVFKPERYLEPYNEPLPTDVVFGYGRRKCPGRFLAQSSLYLTYAQVLSVFEIRQVVNKRGEEVRNTHTFLPSVAARPGPFKVDIVPRSEKHATMIDALLEKFPLQESNAKDLPEMDDTLLKFPEF